MVSDVFDFFFGILVKVVDIVVYCEGKYLLIGNGYYWVEEECCVLELFINSCCDVLVIYFKVFFNEELIEYVNEVKMLVLINCYIF